MTPATATRKAGQSPQCGGTRARQRAADRYGRQGAKGKDEVDLNRSEARQAQQELPRQEFVPQCRPKIGCILRQADAAGGDGKRSAEGKLPDEEEGNHAADRMASVQLGEITIGTAGAGHGRTQFGPDHAVAGGKQRAHHPATIACGPPCSDDQGMVMNGPTPIMSIMFRAVALRRLRPRTSGDGSCSALEREVGIGICLLAYFTGSWSCPALTRFTNKRTAPGTRRAAGGKS